MAKIRIETDSGNIFEGTYATTTSGKGGTDLVITHHLEGVFDDGEVANITYTWNNDDGDAPDRRPHLLEGIARGREVWWEDPCDGIDSMGHDNWEEWCLIKDLGNLVEAVESMYASG